MKKTYITALFIFIFVAGLCSGVFLEKARLCRDSTCEYPPTWHPGNKKAWHGHPIGNAHSTKAPPGNKHTGKDERKMLPRDMYGREHELVRRISFMLHMTQEQEKQYFDLLVQNREEIVKIILPLKGQIIDQVRLVNQKVLEILTPEQSEKYQEIVKEFIPSEFAESESETNSTDKIEEQLSDTQ